MSLVYPCTPQRVEQTVEKHIGDHQPWHFSVNSDVMIRDLRPNATKKWRKGTITKFLGPLNYEVNIDGYTRQAHIDHILPCPQTISDAGNSSSADTPSHQDDDDIIMPIVNSELSEANDNTAELVTLRPCRTRQPPKWLIEEMD